MLMKAPQKNDWNERDSDTFKVHIATHTWEKEEIYKLRYQVYVEEMAKPIINHSAENQLYDELDDRSILLYVANDKTIIATARLTIATAGNYPVEMADIFKLRIIQNAFNDATLLYSLCTKLAVRKNFRNTTALYLILSEIYKILADQNIQFWFGGCNPCLIPLYERLGFRRFAPNFRDEGYGLLVPIVIIVNDTEYLHTVRSPLYRQARKRTGNPATAQKFAELFPAVSRIINSRLTSPQDLWDFIAGKLGKSLADLPGFRKVPAGELMSLLASGAVFSCTPGDWLLEENMHCHDLYLLLSGSIAVRSAGITRILRAGERIGSSGFQPDAVTAVTLEESELLVIPQQSLEQLSLAPREIAATTTENTNRPYNY
ncbi:hypothetical protein P22_3147 [Propionispora sp. 2/2-37]|uniref:N-acyl amino acid synthase FeeM domain-containing protein n=1 Tax=Propionispora sp. 2/2-37 TaxID=1677858 RepID=UPI0006BB7F6D|nr:cyclic nucleotide-binding domain-containing protein [Propionispora sp. 2/2-37]CUH97021.1 hypothetical protein P22_3147 [Propionispora sp. 2/2-37]